MKCDSKIDYVMLEWRVMTELYDQGVVGTILPIFIGDKDPATSKYSDYLKSDCHPALNSEIVVDKLEDRLRDCFEKEGRTPLYSNVTVKSIVSRMNDRRISGP